jgi:hypothetical protein
MDNSDYHFVRYPAFYLQIWMEHCNIIQVNKVTTGIGVVSSSWSDGLMSGNFAHLENVEAI